MAFIYKIVNTINGKLYVGKTEHDNPLRRWAEHKNDATKDHMMNRSLYRAMNKYGCENFLFEVIEETDVPEQRERELIEELNSFGKNGYNMTFGGDGSSYLALCFKEVEKLYNKTKSAQKTGLLLGVDGSTVKKLLRKNKVLLYSVYYNQGVKIYCHELKKSFTSFPKAVDFVLDNGLSKAKRKSIKHRISDVVNGQRFAYLGLKWTKIV